jgi:V8-like Glu-specific endopeptidase
VRRRLLLLAVVAGIAVYALSGTSPKPSIRDETLAHWTIQRLRAWVALRAPGDPSATASPTSGRADTGQPWSASGAIARSSGRIFSVMNGDDSACSGTVLTDRSADVSLVITAAHCVYDLEAFQFATDWLFVPGLAQGEIPDCGRRPLGCWTPKALLIERAFTSTGTFNQLAVRHDIGIAVIGPGPANDQLDQVAGGLALAPTSVSDGELIDLVGYPGDRQYSGSALTFCSGPMSQEGLPGIAIWALDCDMTGGASGGAWVTGGSTTDPMIASVTSGSVGGRTLVGPIFDPETNDLIAAAETATANTQLGQ